MQALLPPRDVVFLFIGTPGLLVCAYGFWAAYSSARARTWPSVSGTITQVDSVRRWGGLGQGRSILVVTVRYTYQIGVDEWTGARIRFGDGINAALGGLMGTVYVVGDRVQVHYDPRLPSNAVLETGVRVLHVVMMLFGLGIVVVAAAIAL